MLGPERQHNRVVARGRLQLEVESPAEPFPECQPQRAVHPGATGRVNDELHPARVVEEALDHEMLGRGQGSELPVAGREVGDDLLGDGTVDPGKSLDDLDGPPGTPCGAVPGVFGPEGGLDGAAQCGDRLGQLGRPRRCLTEPERHRRRGAIGVDHPDRPRLDPADPPHGAAQEEHVARHRLNRPVLVDRAHESVLRLEHDPEVRDVRDRPAGGHGSEAGTASRPEHAVHAVAVQVSTPAAAPGDDPLADELHDRLEVAGAELAVVRRPAGEAQQLLFAAALGIRCGALGDQLLCENVQRCDRRRDRVQIAGADRDQQRRALHELVTRERIHAADRNTADMVLGPPDALEESGDAPGRAELAYELHRADVDSELKGCRRDHRPELTGAKACLHAQPAVHGQAAVVGLDAVLPEAVSQLMGNPLGHSPGVHEHERRPVLVYVCCDAFEHRRHLLVGRHGAELVVGKLDGDVEPALMSDVDSETPGLATGQSPFRSGTHQEPGNGPYRALGCREADPDRSLVRRDEAVQPLQAEREVSPALVTCQGMDLVDDHRPHRREHLPAACRREQEIERLGRRHDDLGAVAQHRRALGGRRVAVADRHLYLRRLQAELDRDFGDLGQGLSEVLAHVDRQCTQRRDVHDVGPAPGVSRLGRPVTTVDSHEKRCKGLARPGGSGDQGVEAGGYGRPAFGLRLGRPGRVAPPEPFGDRGMERVEHFAWSAAELGPP